MAWQQMCHCCSRLSTGHSPTAATSIPTSARSLCRGAAQPLPHLCGAQLVGQRIRVYWRKDDEFYSGTVVAYDATRDDALCYQVRYDVDGELLWDALWDEERNAGFLLEGEGGDHAQLDEGQGGSWELDEETEPLGPPREARSVAVRCLQAFRGRVAQPNHGQAL